MSRFWSGKREALGELLDVIVERFSPLLTLVEFEGDCVYARADGASVPAGEVLLETFESTYVTFRDRVEAVRRHTTCTCNACRLIPTASSIVKHYGIPAHYARLAELLGREQVADVSAGGVPAAAPA